jgi:hypothetical protein
MFYNISYLNIKLYIANMKKLLIILTAVVLIGCSKENPPQNVNENKTELYSIELFNYGTFYDVELTTSNGDVFFSKEGTDIINFEFKAIEGQTLDLDCDRSMLVIKCENHTITKQINSRRIIFLNKLN